MHALPGALQFHHQAQASLQGLWACECWEAGAELKWGQADSLKAHFGLGTLRVGGGCKLAVVVDTLKGKAQGN